MNYFKISYLNLPAIREKYTFLLEVDDNNICERSVGYSADKINKYDNPKDPSSPILTWLKDNNGRLTEEEIEKGEKISKDEFEVAWQQATRDQRKN